MLEQTPTFGSRIDLPSVAEAPPPPPPLKLAVVLTGPPVRKKMLFPLSVAPLPSSPSPNLASFMSPRAPLDAVPAAAASCALTRPAAAVPAFPCVSPPLAQPPFVPNTLRHIPSSPVLPPAPAAEAAVACAVMNPRADAQLQLTQSELCKRSGSIVTPLMVCAAGGGESGLGNRYTYGHGLVRAGARRNLERGAGSGGTGMVRAGISTITHAAAREVDAHTRGAD
ncbi:hypothetical protein B0H14DRAFT_3658807 [Mycena olivaceomarginata]|nr:hypothetical protein B0H14DRAFT_3658807 [Mycena olivaceomarginata]